MRFKGSGLMRTARSTLTPVVAAEMRPYYDAAIKTGQPITIRYDEFPRCAPATLYRKVLDGIKWLITMDELQNNPLCTAEQRGAYAKLRLNWKIAITDEGIDIHPDKFRVAMQTVAERRNIVEQAVEQHMKEHALATTQWKEELMKFLQESTSGAVFSREHVALTHDEVEWLQNVCEQVGAGWDYSENKITVVNV